MKMLVNVDLFVSINAVYVIDYMSYIFQSRHPERALPRI